MTTDDGEDRHSASGCGAYAWRRGCRRRRLAERSGLSAQAIGALETGKRRRPYPHTVSALADALGLSESERVALAEARVAAISRGDSAGASLAAAARTLRRPGGGGSRGRRSPARREGAANNADRSRRRRQDEPGACRGGAPPAMRSAVTWRSSLLPQSPTPRSSPLRSRRRWVSRPLANTHRTRSYGRRCAPADCCWCSTTSNICPRRRSGCPACWRPARG